ncbi:MAG: glycosyltransferase family 4 protein [Gemmataceae bacterium]
MRIVIITAGAAGMYCGSCLKDNTLAGALIARSHDCLLIPTYTPLTLDEPDESTAPIYLGGVNVFLDEYRFSRWLPRFAKRWLDAPSLLRFVTRFANSGDYAKLGELTLSMLRGEAGRQAEHVIQLAEHLANDVKPDVVVLSNVLLSGIAPALKRRLDAPIIATLQGDDLFLDSLTSTHRSAAILQIQSNYVAVAGSIATSASYAEHMSKYLGLARANIHLVRPGIRVENFQTAVGRPSDELLTIGFFARIAPEKGLHRLVAALLTAKLPPFRLRISGWLGASQRRYLDKCLSDFRKQYEERVEYIPSPTLADKVRFLQSVDIFSVPAAFHEPKGIYLLEAMASGVPVVQPSSGAFPELVGMTQGGLLVEANNDQALAAGLEKLAHDPQLRKELGQRGQAAVKEIFNADDMASNTEAVLEKYLLGRIK